MAHILDLGIKGIHEAYVKGEITPLEIVKESLRRAKEDKNNAFELICEEEALKEASELMEVEVDNLLWGIPYVCKDNYSTKGI
ncbi:MAG: Asp-tRNA(Asn)/Glu-tRNA(Gln) amidotransferase subunit GatA, partial [Bacilli bacterium]|nr:Asp-tRNA(Asn)/Glu-tRNA(Gln) amidotransferase subunit GatA [Bacilli bacterium]